MFRQTYARYKSREKSPWQNWQTRIHCLPKAHVSEDDIKVTVRMLLNPRIYKKVRLLAQSNRLFVGLPSSECSCKKVYCRCDSKASVKAMLKVVPLSESVDTSLMVAKYDARGMLRVVMAKRAVI